MVSNGAIKSGDGTGNGHHAPASVSGGVACAVDPGSERDRGAIREAIRRWPRRFKALTPERLDEFVEGLVEAREAARQVEDPATRAKILDSCAKTATMMEAIHQRDDHKAADLDRGASDTTVNVNVGVTLKCPPPRVIGGE